MFVSGSNSPTSFIFALESKMVQGIIWVHGGAGISFMFRKLLGKKGNGPHRRSSLSPDGPRSRTWNSQSCPQLEPFKMRFVVHVRADVHICQPPGKLTCARDQIPSLSVPPGGVLRFHFPHGTAVGVSMGAVARRPPELSVFRIHVWKNMKPSREKPGYWESICCFAAVLVLASSNAADVR